MILDKENELSSDAKNGIVISIVVDFIIGIGFTYFAIWLISNSYKNLELLPSSPLIATLFFTGFSMFYASLKIRKRLVGKTIISGDRFYIQLYHSNKTIDLNSFGSYSIQEKNDFVTYIFFHTKFSPSYPLSKLIRTNKGSYLIKANNHRYYLCPSLLTDKNEGEEFALTLVDKLNSN